MLTKQDITALVIWWCEGTKPRRDKRWKNAFLYPVEVINSDPRIVKIFLDYLINKERIDKFKIKGQLQIHEGDDKTELESYWSNKLDLPIQQFNKTIVRKKGNKPGKNKGTFKLRLYSKDLFFELDRKLKSILNYTESGAIG